MTKIYNRWEREDIAKTLINQGYLVHATPKDFDRFDPSKIEGDSRAMLGYGFYFSNKPHHSSYGKYLKVIKEDDFNFIHVQTQIAELPNMFENGIFKAEQNLRNARSNQAYDLYDEQLKNMGGYGLCNAIRNAIKEYNVSTIGGLMYKMRDPGMYWPKLVQLFTSCNVDGYTDGDQYVVCNFDKLNQCVMSVECDFQNIHKETDERGNVYKIQSKPINVRLIPNHQTQVSEGKKIIRLTEGDLREIIKESVNIIFKQKNSILIK